MAAPRGKVATINTAVGAINNLLAGGTPDTTDVVPPEVHQSLSVFASTLQYAVPFQLNRCAHGRNQIRRTVGIR